jgi:hypothetical protein
MTIYTVSRRQRFPLSALVLGKLQWHQIADLAELSPEPTTEFYLSSHANYPLPC